MENSKLATCEMCDSTKDVEFDRDAECYLCKECKILNRSPKTDCSQWDF